MSQPLQNYGCLFTGEVDLTFSVTIHGMFLLLVKFVEIPLAIKIYNHNLYHIHRVVLFMALMNPQCGENS